MARLTDQEHKQRRKKIQEEALSLVAARGQFNFRLDARSIRRLYKLAGNREKPVSTMVREWVLERLQMEETSQYPTPPWAQELKQQLTHIESLISPSGV